MRVSSVTGGFIDWELGMGGGESEKVRHWRDLFWIVKATYRTRAAI